MCEFKPGDEVVCVDDSQRQSGWPAAPMCGISKGAVYTVSSVGVWPVDGVTPSVFLVEARNDRNAKARDCGYAPDRFRKVQRRDLSAWLKTATKFEEPKRKKANA